jgi:hypothetical protein
MVWSACNDAVAVAFVKKYQAGAAWLAGSVHVPVEFILGVAASETGYGGKGNFVQYSNFFSMHAKSPDDLPWLATGVVEAAATVHHKHPVYVAKYASFETCGLSFIAKYGKAIFGISTPKDFALALQGAGFNPGDARKGGNPKFVDDLVSVIDVVKLRLSCPA